MAIDNVMTSIHKGMDVRAEDGVALGTVVHVWMGLDPAGGRRCDEEECSRLEIHLSHRGGTRYIPYGAIAGVSGRTVHLNLSAAAFNEKLWHRRPDWLPPETANEDFEHLIRPHPPQGSY